MLINFQVKVFLCLGLIFLVINVIWAQVLTGPYKRNAEPVNINWVFSLPWDVSNTLRAPLGGPLSLILSSGLAIIMFFGMMVSPVYYLLGTPTRKYHINDAIFNRFTSMGKRGNNKITDVFPKLSNSQRDGDAHGNETLSTNGNGTESTASEKTSEEIDSHYPEFVDNAFWLIGEQDEECRKLMVCHAHGFFNYLPASFISYYRIFSSKMIAIPTEFQDAIILGMEDQSLCMKSYPECKNDIVTITKNTILKILAGDFSFITNYFSSWKSLLED